MWVFGHLGIGSKLAAPLSRKLPYGWLLFGTLLPDLIDKPLYYLSAFATGRHGSAIGLISCTRTLGHTALFTFALAGLATFRRSPILAAVVLGVASHLMLDGFQDYWTHQVLHVEGENSLLMAALFPFYENHFAEMPYESWLEHLKSGRQPILVTAEVVGLAILGWDWWKKKWRPQFVRPKFLRRIGLVSRKSKAVR